MICSTFTLLQNFFWYWSENHSLAAISNHHPFCVFFFFFQPWANLNFLVNSMKVWVTPVDAATAPRSMGGMPNVGTMNAAVKHVILAVAEEEADSVLWWKFWSPKFPKPFKGKKKEERKSRHKRRKIWNSFSDAMTNQKQILQRIPFKASSSGYLY